MDSTDKVLVKLLVALKEKIIHISSGGVIGKVKVVPLDDIVSCIDEVTFNTIEPQTATSGNLNSNDKFERVVEKRITQIRNTLNRKAVEYAVNDDRFHNFKVAARINNTTPEKALKGMMLKHEVSVQDLIDNPGSATEELINEKIGDNINYLILLEGLLRERIK